VNISALAQQALRSALGIDRVNKWLDEVRSLPPTGVSHERALEAVTDALYVELAEQLETTVVTTDAGLVGVCPRAELPGPP
jgi:predicted nucleic acid-binding protein